MRSYTGPKETQVYNYEDLKPFLADIALERARSGRSARPVSFDQGMERALIAHVEIEQGIEGLVHVSEMDWTNKNVHPSKVVALGDEVGVPAAPVLVGERGYVGADGVGGGDAGRGLSATAR
mgnify:CR=1 FL=1